ncbi:hypothetical protein NP233_g11408 [Leucocoprinus birnbaumii]|uniref:Uncharacterized protein n=1 Tax=Leucocoprinus birnbaumii TaxID=56174 RepID=A0AAD5VGL8_9AGAR|nr:hypothetical protein NP233_g11408 [Leucocoprinus birnbaumii]
MYQTIPKKYHLFGKNPDDSDRLLATVEAVSSSQLEVLVQNGVQLEESASVSSDPYLCDEFRRSLGVFYFSDSSDLSEPEDEDESTDKEWSVSLTAEEEAQMKRDKRKALRDRSRDADFLARDIIEDAPSSTSASDADDPTPAPAYFAPARSKKGKSKTRSKWEIKHKRQNLNGRAPRPQIRAAALEAGAKNALPTSLDRETLAIQKGGLQYYIDREYKVVEWDGFETVPLLDSEERVFMVLAGQPRSPEYAADCKELYKLITGTLTTAAANPKYPEKFLHHKRGDYTTLDAGITYAQGMTTISNRSLMSIAQSAANAILGSSLSNQVVGHLETVHATFAPRLYQYVRRYVRKLFKKSRYRKKLRRLNKGSFFTCASPHSGPKAVTTCHTDEMNLGFAWCGVVNVGEFDPVLGGHLVLEELAYGYPVPSQLCHFVTFCLHSPLQYHNPRTRATRSLDLL